MATTLTSKGQVTIPKQIRDAQRYSTYFSGVSLVSPAPGTGKQ